MYRTPGPGQEGALPGTATRTTIPSAVWRQASAAGASSGLYQLELIAYRAATATNEADPGAVGFSAAYRSTAISVLVTEMPVCGEVEHFEALRGRVREQSGPDVTAPIAGGGYRFRAVLGQCLDGGVKGAAVSPPGGAPLVLPPPAAGVSALEVTVDSAASFVARFPPGGYRFEIEGGQSGLRTSALVLHESELEPLRVANWTDLQSLANSDAVEIRLVPGEARSAADDLQCSIVGPDGQVVYETAGWWNLEERIPGNASSFVVPRGVLGPDRQFEGRVSWLRRDSVDETTFAGGIGLGATFVETRFPIGSQSLQVLDERFGILTPADLPDFTLGTRSVLGLDTRAGRPPVSWALVGGALPDGLSLDPDSGDLSGIPSRGGVFTFTVEARDAGTNVASRTFNVRVTGSVPALGEPVAEMPEGTAGMRYCGVLRASGGVGPYVWELAPGSSALPRGLVLDAGTGVIDGVPEEGGRFAIRLRVSDQASQARELAAELVVAPAEPTVPLEILEYRQTETGHLLRLLAPEPGSYLLEATEDWVTWQVLAETNEAPVGPWAVPEPGGVPYRFLRVRQGAAEVPAVPYDIHAQLDPVRTVAAVLPAPNRVLALTNAQGVRLELQLPSDALAHPTEIRMTEVVAIPDLPVSGGLLAAVALEPDGLVLRRPGTLTVRFPAGVSAETTSFAAAGLGEDFHPVGSRNSGTEVILSIPHFSLFGVAAGKRDPGAGATGCNLEGWVRARVENVAAAPRPDRHRELVNAFGVWFDEGQRGVRAVLRRAAASEREVLNGRRELTSWRDLVTEAGADPRLAAAGGGSLIEEMAPRLRDGRKLLTRAFLNGLRELESRCSKGKAFRDAFLLRAKVEIARECVADGLCDPVFDWAYWENRVSDLLRCEVVLRSAAISKGSSAYNSVRVQSLRGILLWDPPTGRWTGDQVPLNLAAWNYRDGGGTGTKIASVDRGGFSPNELRMGWLIKTVRVPAARGCASSDTAVAVDKIELDFHAVGDFDLTLIPKVGEPRNFHDDFWRGPFGIAMESYLGDAGYLLAEGWEWTQAGTRFARWNKSFGSGGKLEVMVTVDLYSAPH